jgi:hypothetical protein
MQNGSKNTSIKHTINKSFTININLINRKNLTINFTLLNMAPESFPWITSCFPSAQADEQFSGSYQAHNILYTLFHIIVIKNSPTTSNTLLFFWQNAYVIFNQMSQSHYIITTVNLQPAIICVRAKHWTVLHTFGKVTLKRRIHLLDKIQIQSS